MRMEREEDDSTGKRKVPNLRHRSAVLSAALLVGMCLGVIVSEKLYLLTQESDLPEGAVAAVRSRKLEVAGGGGGGASLTASGGVSGGWDGIPRSSGKPSNELEGILRRVAPQGEVSGQRDWTMQARPSTHCAAVASPLLRRSTHRRLPLQWRQQLHQLLLTSPADAFVGYFVLLAGDDCHQ